MEYCNICCTKTKKMITCLWCANKACNFCVEKYLLSKANSNCLYCSKEFDEYFIWKNFSNNFYNNVYRNHKADILLQKEKSLLVYTQDSMKRKKEIFNRRKENAKQLFVNNEYRLYSECGNQTKNIFENELLNYMENKEESKYNEIREFLSNRKTFSYLYDVYKNMEEIDIEEIVNTNTKSNVEKYSSFVYKCESKENCNGLVKNNFCGICNLHHCNVCTKIKQDEHTCNLEDAKSVDIIKKNSKSCPNCNVRISKVDGCDQMWCVSCHVAFDWRTGEIENGEIHNPHYFEFIKQSELNFEHKENQLYPRNNTEEKVYSFIGMIEYEIIDEIEYNINKHIKFREKYLLNLIDEKKWKSLLKSAQKKEEKNREINNIFSILITCTKSLINMKLNENEFLTRFKELILYFNNSMLQIGKRFKNSPYCIINETHVKFVNRQEITHQLF